MSKKFTNVNVLEAARNRIQEMVVSNDEVWCGFSGGKDSLVVLSLIEEQIKDKKVNVVFRDEEMIPNAVIDFINELRQNDKYNFIYIATQLESDITILGQSKRYVQWDVNRQWIREKPKDAIEFDGVKQQSDFEQWFFNKSRHSIGLALGLRADESLMRAQGFLSSKHPYFRKTGLPNVTIYNPIYDWSERDVFKYLYEHNIKYCFQYDNQLFNQVPLRVATVLHSEASRYLPQLKGQDPILYNQIMQIFPEIEIQARYLKEAKNTVNIQDIAMEYKKRANNHPIKAILLYIEQNYTGLKKQQAIKVLLSAKSARESRIKKGTSKSKFGGYPYYAVFKTIARGLIKRATMFPVLDDKEIYYEFENITQ